MLKNHWMKITLVASLFMLLTAAPASAETEHGAEESAHTQEPLNFFDFSSKTSHPLVALFFNFGALVIIVYLLMRKPLGTRFRKRKADLVAALEEAAEAKKRAEEAIDAAKAKMAAIDDEIGKVREDIIAAGERESAEIVARAEQQAARLVQETEKLVTHEISLMAETLRREVVEEIIKRAERELKSRISETDHETLFRDYLNGVTGSGAATTVKH
jgi:F-type H+-transporting ATPase subunit b